MSQPLSNILRHILDEIDFLRSESTGLKRSEFEADETLKRAFVRSLEIIGEAVKQIPDDVRREHSEIPWRAVAGMRDRLIHHYFGVDYDIVWDVVQSQLDQLAVTINQILNEIE